MSPVSLSAVPNMGLAIHLWCDGCRMYFWRPSHEESKTDTLMRWTDTTGANAKSGNNWVQGSYEVLVQNDKIVLTHRAVKKTTKINNNLTKILIRFDKHILGVTLISLCVSSLHVTVTAFFFVFLCYQQKSAAPARLVGIHYFCVLLRKFSSELGHK